MKQLHSCYFKHQVSKILKTWQTIYFWNLLSLKFDQYKVEISSFKIVANIVINYQPS